jgi:MoaA/NifB/PqqE/SkfB family radical SAM enzyme
MNDSIRLEKNREFQGKITGGNISFCLAKDYNCCTVSLTLHENIYPRAVLEVSGKKFSVHGWYNEIAVIDGSKEISIKIQTNAENIKISWWDDNPDNYKEKQTFIKYFKPKYEYYLSWHVTNHCNLGCDYCFIGLEKRMSDKIPEIDIPGLRDVLSGFDKPVCVNLSGGEPFLIKNFVEACSMITKDHYISIVSNLTSGRVKDLIENVDTKHIDFFVCSFHPFELIKRNAVDKFMKNYYLIKDAGINARFSIVLWPPVIERLPEFLKIINDKNIIIYYEPFLGVYNNKEYPAAYTEEELQSLGIIKKDIERSFYINGNYCNAGFNACIILGNGDAIDCFEKKNKMGNIYEGIKFLKKMDRCDQRFCKYPVCKFLPMLYNLAIEEKAPVRSVF